MRVPICWLQEWVDVEASPADIADRLTLAGLEVDTIEAAAPDFDGIFVARIESIAPHPDADKLRVCQVNDGTEAFVQVVCGAANAREGLIAPFARVGAVLPGDFKIKKAKLRGVESNGMLCSEQELGLADAADGLLELPADAQPGTNIRDYLDLNDSVIEIELTPNRGDCASIMGVAREVGTLFETSMRQTANSQNTVAENPTIDTPQVSISAADACTRYAGRSVSGISTDVATPIKVAERLRRGGIRSISPLVDITNWILLELGQPMHAFDQDKLVGNICVRMAVAGEELELLDGTEVVLDDQTLVIADDAGPVAMAGVMGGARTAVSESTTNLFFESACFSPLSVAGTGRRYKITSDSLYRFERGVDPNLQINALNRATAMAQELVGGIAGPVVLAQGTEPSRSAINLRLGSINGLLGVSVSEGMVEQSLTRLGVELEAQTEAGEWRCTAPSWRYDLRIEADLIEEIARIIGYEQLPAVENAVYAPLHAPASTVLSTDYFRDLMVTQGYREVVSYSFSDANAEAVFGTDNAGVLLDNPIASQLAVMRTSLWSSLLPVVQGNLARGNKSFRFFEVGRRFHKDGSEQNMLAGVATGLNADEQWGDRARTVDFFDIKADLDSMLANFRPAGSWTWAAAEHEALHPGQTANLNIGGEDVGLLGKIHPSVASALKLPNDLFWFELNRDLLSASSVEAQQVPDTPSSRRDLALLVPEKVYSQQLLDCIRETAPASLRELLIFDVYRGENIDKGYVSIAVGLIFQDESRTLTDREVDEVIEAIASKLQSEIGITIRD